MLAQFNLLRKEIDLENIFKHILLDDGLMTVGHRLILEGFEYGIEDRKN